MAEGTAARRARSGDSEESSLKENASNFTEAVKNKASEQASNITDTINQQRDAAASTLGRAASTLHDTAESLPGEKIKSMAHRAADSMERGSEYIRQHDTSAMAGDVIELVKKYPGQAIMVSLAAGFLIGRLFSRD